MSSNTLALPEYARPRADNYLTHSRGILSWLLSLDHKRIGIMYMVAVLASFFIGGVFAVLLRTELIAPGPTLASDPTKARDLYNHIFTIHGAVMVFMFIIPAIPAILGNFVLPIMLGAKDVAFPRLNLLSFYCWLGGGIFFLYVLLSGVLYAMYDIRMWGGFGLDTGWTFYTPYSTTRSESGVIPATFGAFILGFSSILTGVNFIATIHTLRPRGMTWFRMPLFLWGLYATAIIQILATPVLAITLLLLLAEKFLKVGIFDPTYGGDPVLYQHFFWFYSHPAVYIMILPAMGITSELVSTFSRKHIFGYKFIAYSSIAIALLGFLVWGHHMFTSGQSALGNAIFSLLTFSVAIPSAVKVFNWLSTMHGGSIRLKTPMLYAMGFIGLFTIGGLTGLFLGALSTDIHFHDTYFIVAHIHYVLFGGSLFGIFAGIYHWFPKMFGRMMNEFWGKVHFVVTFLLFNIGFYAMHNIGIMGAPRRYADLRAWIETQDYNQTMMLFNHLISFSVFLLVGLQIIFVINFFYSLFFGPKAPRNPWEANTLEWVAPSPPPHGNFEELPVVYRGPYEYSHPQVAEDYLPQTRKLDQPIAEGHH